MTMREQMDAAWRGWRDRDETSSPEDRLGFELGFIAALDLIRDPSDEMVERCAEAMRRVVPAYDGDFSVAADAGLTGDEIRNLARACLAAAVGDTTQ